MNVVHFVVGTNDVILNRSHGVMRVRISYVKSLHKTRTIK